MVGLADWFNLVDFFNERHCHIKLKCCSLAHAGREDTYRAFIWFDQSFTDHQTKSDSFLVHLSICAQFAELFK